MPFRLEKITHAASLALLSIALLSNAFAREEDLYRGPSKPGSFGLASA